MKLYLGGPMRGISEFNHPAFHKAAAHLRERGYEVFSPAEHNESIGLTTKGLDGDQAVVEYSFPLRQLMKSDLIWICDNADGMATLEGWEQSRGTLAEMALFEALSLHVKMWYEWQ